MADFDAHRAMALALVVAFAVVLVGSAVGLVIDVLRGGKK